MGLAYASLWLLILTLLAVLAVWVFFYKIPKKEEGESNLSELDKDLIKTKESADIHKNRLFYFVIAFFVVSIYAFKLITWTEVTEYKQEVKKLPPKFDGSIVEIEEIEIKDPEPPKPTVIKVPKVVPNTVVKKDTVKQEELPDDSFEDDLDEELDEEKPEEKKVNNTVYEFVEQEAGFSQGGEIGFQNFVLAQVGSKLERGFDVGEYYTTIVFIVEADGRISNVKISDEEPPDDPQIAAFVLAAVKRSPKWTPAKSDGENVRQLVRRDFAVEIQ